jgi:hypothetical protein
MPTSHPSRLTAGVFVGLALLLLLSVAIAACGSSSASFEGTWFKPGDQTVMVITKAGDGYDVVIKASVSDASGLTLKGTTDGDAVVVKDPTGQSQDEIRMTVSGDTLTMKSGDQTETLQRGTPPPATSSSPMPAASSPSP